jgi:hypothetical protein
MTQRHNFCIKRMKAAAAAAVIAVVIGKYI